MRIALCQINTPVGALNANVARILDAAREAKGQGAQLCLFPELALTGYPPRDLLERHGFRIAAAEAEARLVADLPLPALFGAIGGFDPHAPHLTPRLTNDAVFAANGRVISRVTKRLLPTYDVFDEWRYFEPGTTPGIATLDPTLDPTIAGTRLGITICEDAWSPVEAFGPGLSERRYGIDPVAEVAAAGATCIVNLSASPYHAGKAGHRGALFAQHARRHRLPVAFVNLVGANDELVFDGGSMAFDPSGNLLAALPRFREAVHVVDLFAPATHTPSPDPLAPLTGDAHWADLYDALVLGVADYFRKTHHRRAVLGLSGGIDSALTATILVDALGAANVTGLAMPSRYSSQGSLDDAAALARNLGIRLVTLGIEETFGAFLSTLDAELTRNPALPFDTTPENLQSRCRGTLVMALANRLGALAVTTGNKSEIATGYCTLYGDMAGGIAPLSDVYKTSVWALSRFVNRHGERIPLSSIEKPPSAELRPNQTDQDTLPPYDALDDMLIAFLEHHASCDEIIARGHDPDTVRAVLRRVELNEFKRRQMAPGLRITPRAFGVGRRIPVARGFDGL